MIVKGFLPTRLRIHEAKREEGRLMKSRFATLYEIQDARPVSPETDPAFFQLLRTGLLLALGEQGILEREQIDLTLERLSQEKGKQP